VQIPKPGKGGKFKNLSGGVELRRFAQNVFIRGLVKRGAQVSSQIYETAEFLNDQPLPYPIPKYHWRIYKGDWGDISPGPEDKKAH
jgi:hypothetical protein